MDRVSRDTLSNLDSNEDKRLSIVAEEVVDLLLRRVAVETPEDFEEALAI